MTREVSLFSNLSLAIKFYSALLLQPLLRSSHNAWKEALRYVGDYCNGDICHGEGDCDDGFSDNADDVDVDDDDYGDDNNDNNDGRDGGDDDVLNGVDNKVNGYDNGINDNDKVNDDGDVSDSGDDNGNEFMALVKKTVLITPFFYHLGSQANRYWNNQLPRCAGNHGHCRVI